MSRGEPAAERPWESLVLGAGIFAAFLLCLGPMVNPDLSWHLAAARDIVAARAVPRADAWSWTLAGRPWVDFEWTTQLIFYGLDRAGGTSALWMFKTFAFWGLALILTALLRLWRLPDLWAAVAAPVLMCALLPAIDIRPELFSLLFFFIQLYALENKRLGLLRLSDAAVLAAQLAFYSLWANLHAGFPMGLVLCVLYGAAERLRSGAGARASAWTWAAAGALGTLINPYGLGVYAVLWDHAKNLAVLRRLILEWGEARYDNAFLYGYWAVIPFSCLGLWLAWFRRRAAPLEHLFAAAVFSLFATRFFRTTSYATLAVFPFGLLAWHSLSSPPWWRRLRPWLLCAGLGLGAWNSARVLRASGFPRLSTTKDREPLAAFRFLRAQKDVLSGLPLYNNKLVWGGPIDAELYPDYKTFMDGRYLFTGLIVEAARARESPARWREFLDRRGIELALVQINSHRPPPGVVVSGRPFEAVGMPRSEWALVYWDSSAMVVVRRAKVPPGWLKLHEFRFLWPRDLRALGAMVRDGKVSFDEVSAEIDRYQREIGDPWELYLLRSWRQEMREASPDSTTSSRRRRDDNRKGRRRG